MKAVFNRAFPDYISAQLRSEFPEFSAMRGVRPLAPWRQVHGPGDWTRLRKSAVRNSSVPAGRRHGKDRGSLRQSTQDRPNRSEEHTSELQSLMRISYAVFCLKKKKIKK